MITSGYVDKPGANWVVRLLEIASIPANELNGIKKYHPLLGATDRWLFGQILGRYERSATFALQAKSAEKYIELARQNGNCSRELLEAEYELFHSIS